MKTKLFLILLFAIPYSLLTVKAQSLSASISSVHVSCYGTNNGSATVTATGGTPPYSYAWNTAPVQTTATATGLSPAYYDATVTDNLGATFTVTTQINSGLPPDSWSVQANFGGVGRYGAVAFVVNNKAYLGTGTSTGTDYLDDFWEYDPQTNSWSQKANYTGGGVKGASAFAVGTMGYVVTGSTGTATFTNALVEYDAINNVWTAKANFPSTARNKATGFSIGTKGYITCGTDGTNFFNDCWEYTPSSDSWLSKANLPASARAGASGFNIGTKGYVGCGLLASTLSTGDDFYEYSQVSNTWAQKTNYPGGAGEGITAFAIGGKGYFCGGTSSGYSTNLWEYEALNNVWTMRTSLTGSSRAYGAGFSIGSQGYISTGDSPTMFINLNDLWQYTPAGLNPSPIIYGPSAVCGLITTSYSVSALVSSTYVWTTPTGLTITSGQGTPSINVNVSAGTVIGNVQCVVNDACATTPIGTLPVAKKPQPPTVINGLTSLCGLTTTTFTTPAAAGVTSYSWTVPTGITIASGQGTTAITVNIASTFITGIIKVTAVNTCGNVPGVSLTVYGNVPSTPIYLYGPANVCGMSTASYSCTSSTGALTYTWIVPSFMTITSGTGTTAITVSINSAPVNSSQVSVFGGNACGNSFHKILTISTAATQPGTITGPANTCSLTTATYYIAPVSTATSYVWTPAIGQTITSGQGTTLITVSIAASSGTTTATSYLKVSSINACGSTSAAKTLLITRCLSPEQFNFGIDEKEFSIYPNPATSELRIMDFELQSGVVEMYNLTGSCVLHSEITNPQSEINLDIRAMAKGLYFVRIVSDGRVIYSEKVIKQ